MFPFLFLTNDIELPSYKFIKESFSTGTNVNFSGVASNRLGVFMHNLLF